MPLPAVSERAAETIRRELDRFDAAVSGHIIDGDRLPTVRQVMTPIVAAVRRSVIAAFEDVGAPTSGRAVDDAVNDVATPIREAVTAARRTAVRARRRAPRTAPAEPDDTDGTIAGLVATVGATAAAILLVQRRPARQRTPRLVRQVMRQVDLATPRPTAAFAKMVVRTRTAMVRNNAAAEVVDTNNETGARPWALQIRDGRNGPTDHACEKVDRKYATTRWLRRHLVEHPNCTRVGYPREVPVGARITLR